MKYSVFEFKLFLGKTCIQFISEIPLQITEEIQNFQAAHRSADIIVRICIKNQRIAKTNYCGEDLLLEYYKEDGHYLAFAKKGLKDSATVVAYTSDFSDCTFYINEEEFPNMIRALNKIIQLFPLRQLLIHFDAMILHASRICYNGKTFLFSAPSQVGKSTQAKLWKTYEKAEIVSNDRSLIQKENNAFFTYGYPVDGSEPVYSNKRLPLGAIIILKQGTNNHVERLTVVRALRYLIEQTVADVWNAEELIQIQMLWMDLLEKHPVYLLTCRPEQSAVSCLKEQLMKDGVI